MSYSVLFREFPLDHLDALAPVVREAYGIADFDARANIRRGWGFLERNVTEEQAQRVAAALGDGAVVMDNAQLRVPHDPQVMNGLEIVEGGFSPQLQSPQAERCVIEWPEVAIVAAGGFTEEVIRHYVGKNEKSSAKMMMGLGIFLVTGIPFGIFGGKKEKNAKPVKSNRYITFGRVVTQRGDQFAFNPDHFDFTGLGEKKQLNVAANFRTLLATMSESSSVQLNLGARLLRENKTLTLANYLSVDDFETELLWMFNAAVSD